MNEVLSQKIANFQYLANDSASQVAAKIKKDVRLIGLTRGQFSLIDLIYSILQVTGPAHVKTVTWSAGIKDANTIAWMVNSDLIKSFVIITDHSYVTRQKKYVVQLSELFGDENIRTSEIHAKFTLIENENFKICIRTSMNLNANRTCESFEIDENKEVFDFYNNFIIETFGEMNQGFIANSSQVNKALDRVFNTLKNEFNWQTNE